MELTNNFSTAPQGKCVQIHAKGSSYIHFFHNHGERWTLYVAQKDDHYLHIHNSCFYMYNFLRWVALFQPSCRHSSSGCLFRCYSGLKLTRFGRSTHWSFCISLAVTLQDSNVNDFKFLSDFRCFRPADVTREFEMFKETSCVSPAFTSTIYSVTAIYRGT